jgi:hypothetical protein
MHSVMECNGVVVNVGASTGLYLHGSAAGHHGDVDQIDYDDAYANVGGF